MLSRSRVANALAAAGACAVICAVVASATLLAQGCAGTAPEPRRNLDVGVSQPTYDQNVPPPPPPPVDAGGRLDSFAFTDTTTPPPRPDQGVPRADSAPTVTCRSGEQKFGGRCYRVLHGTDMTYGAAKAACAAQGMVIVAIESANEDTFLYGMLPSTASAAWIGLVRSGGGFRWEATNAAPSFTDWASGEPNNDKGIENCVVMWGPKLSFPALRGQWNDAPCDSPTRDTVLCER